MEKVQKTTTFHWTKDMNGVLITQTTRTKIFPFIGKFQPMKGSFFVMICKRETRINPTKNLPKTYFFQNFVSSAVDLYRPVSKFSSSFSAHLIYVLGEFSATGIHLTKSGKNIIRTLIKMLGNKTLQLPYLILYF